MVFLPQSVQKDFQDVSRELESERYRAERLEEQVNDLTELHQVEIHFKLFFQHIFEEINFRECAQETAVFKLNAVNEVYSIVK